MPYLVSCLFLLSCLYALASQHNYIRAVVFPNLILLTIILTLTDSYLSMLY
jgi:hypothetical protein